MGRNYALTVPQIKEAAKLYAKGYSMIDLEAHFGVSRQAVKNGLLLAGVKLRTRVHAMEIALLRRFIEKPQPKRRGWVWLNPASAAKWQVNACGVGS
jgi:hypothetical protein